MKLFGVITLIKKLIKYFIIIIIIFFIFIFLRYRFINTRNAREEILSSVYLTYNVVNKPYGDYLELIGNVEADNINVISKVSGEIENIFIKKGDTITKDSNLLKINDLNYKITYNSALIEYENSLHLGEKVRDLRKLQLEQARINLNNTLLRSNYSGVVNEIYVNEGDIISQGTRTMNIVNIDSFLVTSYIDEIDLKMINKGMDVILEFNQLNYTTTGKVLLIHPVALNRGGSIVIPIEIEFDHDIDYENIIPGLTTKIKIITMPLRENSFSIPNNSVYFDDNKNPYVIKKFNDEKSIEYIDIGLRNNNYTEVISGLNENDVIIIIPDDKELERLTNTLINPQLGLNIN